MRFMQMLRGEGDTTWLLALALTATPGGRRAEAIKASLTLKATGPRTQC